MEPLVHWNSFCSDTVRLKNAAQAPQQVIPKCFPFGAAISHTGQIGGSHCIIEFSVEVLVLERLLEDIEADKIK